jgi:predicted small integral membrane protein
MPYPEGRVSRPAEAERSPTRAHTCGVKPYNNYGVTCCCNHLRSQAATFNRAKGLAAVAAGLGFLVWFFGFMVIGGEWFQMWQSSQWNGQEAAFRFYLTILVLIFVMQKDY